MRAVAVSRVRNEEDVVEAFVRHHCEVFDRMVVLDDGSTDRTSEILRALGNEGLPLRLLREDRVGNAQGASMTGLMRAAFSEGADWVVPLDADEFFEVRDEAAFGTMCASPATGVVEMPWDNFVFDGEEPSEPNPVLRMDRHTPTRKHNYKVMVPRRLGGTPRASLFEGNHFLHVGGTRLPSERHACVRLCHYPIRSVPQYAAKVAIGMARYAMLRDCDPTWGFHYRVPFETLLTDMAAFSRLAVEDSFNYSLGPNEPRGQEATRGQLAYRGDALRYTSGGDRLVQNLAGFMHQMAIAMAGSADGDARVASRDAVAQGRLAAFVERILPWVPSYRGRSRRA